jgi:hypothetical protein
MIEESRKFYFELFFWLKFIFLLILAVVSNWSLWVGITLSCLSLIWIIAKRFLPSNQKEIENRHRLFWWNRYPEEFNSLKHLLWEKEDK